MASIQNSGFFVLPTELRLEVYGHLLITALTEGAVPNRWSLHVMQHYTGEDGDTGCEGPAHPRHQTHLGYGQLN